MKRIECINSPAPGYDFILGKFSYVYLLVPYIIFIVGFLKLFISIPLLFLTVCVGYSMCRFKNKESVCALSLSSHIILFLVSLFVCWHIGVGSFWSQSYDFYVKNALLQDLVNKSWPLYYDLTGQPLYVQEIIGNDVVGFTYYFFFFLPAAVVGKLYGLFAARLAFLLWSTLGLYLTLCLCMRFICSKTKREPTKYLVSISIALMFSVGGFDIIGWLCCHIGSVNRMVSQIGNSTLFECWNNFHCGLSMYPSLASSLVWAFNQCIPIWLITILVLNSWTINYGLFSLISLSFLYSPWGCIVACSMLLIVLVIRVHKESFKSLHLYFNMVHIAYPLSILIIVGSMYLAQNNPEGGMEFLPMTYRLAEYLKTYIVFIVVEILFFIFILRRYDNPWLWASFIILLILPFFKMTKANDLLMRGSLMAFFVVACFWTIFVLQNFKKKKLLIIFALLLMVPAQLQIFFGNDKETIRLGKVFVREMDGFSKIEDDKTAEMCNDQFFVHDYSHTFFFRYLAKEKR